MLLFHSLSWYKKIMAEYRKAGYHIEIFFVFADLPIMEKRAKEREKSTGRQTDLEHVRLLSQLHVPKCLTLFSVAQIRRTAESAPRSVEQLAHKDFVDRVQLLDNSSNDKPPHVVYDSKYDPEFEDKGHHVDVMKWIRKELESAEHNTEPT